MTKFKPGDKVIMHLVDEQDDKKIPNRNLWGIVGTYTNNLGDDGGRYPHNVQFNGNNYPCAESEIQLLEDE